MSHSFPVLRYARVVTNYDNRWRRTSFSINIFSLLVPGEHALNLAAAFAAPPVDHDDRLADDTRDDSEPLIREIPDQNCPGDTNETGDDADSPLSAINTSRFDLECATTDEHNENLESNDHDDDANEEPVAEYALKHVKLVIETPVVEDVEDLHPNEAVEDDSVELELLIGV